MQRARKIKSTLVGIGVAALLLSGCFPYTVRYVHLEADGISHVRMLCGDSGPPTGAVFEHGDVSILVALEPHGLSREKESFVKVRAPRSYDVSIPDPIATFTFPGADGMDDVEVALKVAPPDWQGPFVEELRQQSPKKEYRFTFSDYPSQQMSGSLKLPALFVEGSVVQVPELKFERKRYGGLAPLNC